MVIQIFPSGPFATNAYVVGCPETKEALIIDPAPGSAAPISHFLQSKNLNPKAIVLTHSHWDHTADCAPLIQEWNIPLYVHPHDAGNVRKPGSDGLPLFMDIEGVEPNFLGETVKIGNFLFSVIHTPGHSPGGICLFEPKENILFSGDTFFQGTIGNLSFPTSNEEEMWKSLEKLAELPKETVVYPGHGPKTTIGNEHWLKNAKELFGG